MEIIIPEKHAYGRHIMDFLEGSLEDIQLLELTDRLEVYEKFSLMELLRKRTLKKIAKQLYELRVPVARANLRFWAVVREGNVLLIDVFNKKKQTLSRKDIEQGLRRVESFNSTYS